jgi:hypothetical protein
MLQLGRRCYASLRSPPPSIPLKQNLKKNQVDTSHKIRARDVIHETRHLFFVTGKIFKGIYYTTEVKRMRIGISEPLLEESEIKKRFLSLVIP